MLCNAFKLILFLCIVSIPSLGKFIDTINQGARQQAGDEVFTDAGFPSRIVSNIMKGDPPSYRRELFVHVEEGDFTQGNIRSLFASLAAKYSKPENLHITVFSDRENLNKAIEVSKMKYIVDFPSNRGVESDWYRKYWPASTGYFRAVYYRNYVEENFTFCPDPQTENCVDVELKGKSDPVTKPDADDKIISAISKGDVDKVKEMLTALPRMSIEGLTGFNILIEAVNKDRYNIVRMLLDAGVNVNFASSQGVTALMYSSKLGRTEIVKELLLRGATVNNRAKSGATALIWAGEAGHIEIVTLLLNSGADPNANDGNGGTALTRAFAHKAVLGLLLDFGADINAQNGDGATALMSAVWHNVYDSAQLLVERGADVLLVDKSKRSALDYAKITQDKKILDILKKVTKQ